MECIELCCPGTKNVGCLLVTLIVACGCAGEGQEASPGSTMGTNSTVAPASEDNTMELPTLRQAVAQRIPEAGRLRSHHDMLASEPHVAGTPGDWRNAQRLAAFFGALDLEVEVQELWVYLSEPRSAELAIVSPAPQTLPIREEVLPEDPDSGHPDTTFGWNAYSASGDVTAQIVYANYGRKEDFAQLRELGIDLTGRIVIARYGGNFRGYKAKFAQEAGAIGLIIYTDPADAGYVKGEMYPQGGFANPSYIQRGSIKTLPYSGDPLTPFVPATEDAVRLDPQTIDLPRIPVQPVGWEAAEPILARMAGPQEAPQDWQGGLPITYRLTGGSGLTVRLKVDQPRKIKRTFNVLATLRGRELPEEKIIVGAHHDAWGFGAADPTAGTIVVCEAARSFAEAARRWNLRPRRSIVFATWGAEEYGIIGSTEWVEANRDDLTAHAVAYLNLDMAAMGPNFGSSAAPSLKRVIIDSTRDVPQARQEGTLTVFDAWLGRSSGGGGTSDATDIADDDREPSVGNLGGGSDHIGFYCHLGIPSAGFSAGGSAGTSYHSNYDTLTWYRQVVGDDYAPALMLTRIVNNVITRLADDALLPLDPSRYGIDVQEHIKALGRRAEAIGFQPEPGSAPNVGPLPDIATPPADVTWELYPVFYAAQVYDYNASLTYDHLIEAQQAGRLSANQLQRINTILLGLERAWLREQGIPDRPWFRSLYVATDEDSGYAAWMLPALRYAIEHRDSAQLYEAVGWYLDIFDRLTASISAIDRILEE